MKKNIFTILTIIFSFFFTILVIYLYGNYKLKIDFKSNFENEEQFKFYLENSKIVNHLRYSKTYQNSYARKEDQLYSELNNGKNSKTILFQGDSWFEQIENIEGIEKILQNSLLNDYKIVNGGITSYSPSLMHAQYKLLIKNFIQKPNIMVIYIDQTDIGDELCRYKELIVRDQKKNLLAVNYEEYPLFKDPFNLHQTLSYSKINFDHKSKIKKIYYYYAYKMKKVYFKSIKKIKFELGYAQYQKCYGDKIYSYLYNLKNEDRTYFEKTVNDFFKLIEEDNDIKKIYIVTHPHKVHILKKKQILDISNLILKLSINYNKFHHINFSKIIQENDYFYGVSNLDIWAEDQMHLNKEKFQIFFNVILKEIEKSL